MTIQQVIVPDLGGADSVDVIELCVASGDSIEVEQPLVVLESDKASMEIPSPCAGVIVTMKVAEGDTVSEGDLLAEVELAGAEAPAPAAAAAAPVEPEPVAEVAAVAVEPAAVAAAAALPALVPDLGGAENVDVIEVCVAVGDTVNEGDSLIVLETDKASMEIPAPATGVILSLAIKEGDTVSEADIIGELTVAGTAPTPVVAAAEPVAAPSPAATPVAAAPVVASASTEEVPALVPDLGGAAGVDVIEVCVAVGDEVKEGDSLIVLETEKASMEIPAPASGSIASLAVQEGSTVNEGDLIGAIVSAASAAAPAPSAAQVSSTPAPVAVPDTTKPVLDESESRLFKMLEQGQPVAAAKAAEVSGSGVHAGPAVRKLARELGVDLREVIATGPRNRIVKDDIHEYVKRLVAGKATVPGAVKGSAIPAIPEVDFSKFGDVEMVKMSRVKKATVANMTRCWLNVPHVTQFDEADITDLEVFRKQMKAEAETAGVKLTPVAFLLKAVASTLRTVPEFNVSLHADGEHIVQKDYVHIGMAVDTPVGLMVPVIRDVDKKSLFEIAADVTEMAGKARKGKLMPGDMQGACFSVSSLGAIGGQGFTPIVNSPEVGILGVSKASIKPIYQDGEFVPRQMLPLSLSYDHRAVNGGDAGRFLTHLVELMGEIRRLLL